jgi:two-component system catabolic regulation response regulator CreB
MKKTVLIFEDEPAIAENLVYALETEGFAARRVPTAAEGLALLASGATFDLVILDVGLPDQSGFEVCKKIRAKSQVPIFFLTARSEEVDRVVGLEIGADDYIVKPFSPREVVARVKAVFRRLSGAGNASTAGNAPASKATGPFTIEEQKARILFRGKDLELSRTEFGLLKALVDNPGHVFSRAQLMEKVWETPDMSLERTIDSHVKSIRAKIRDIDPDNEWIQTHRGFGYSLAELKK